MNHIPADCVVEHARGALDKPCHALLDAGHFHPTVAGMLGATLIRDEVGQVGEPGQKRLLAATWVMDPLQRDQVPLHGVMRLI